MALPQQALRGQTIHSIRRTVAGTYFLAPTKKILEALPYTYGFGVMESRIIPHVEVTMSNHRQGALTCLTGDRCLFHQWHHGILAQQYNGILGRFGPMWDHRGPTQPVILPESSEDFFFAHDETEEERQLWLSRWDALGLGHIDRTIMYDLMNPISADLVEQVNLYPNFTVTPDDWGKWSINRRPDWFAESYREFTAFMALPPPRWWDNARTIDCGDSRTVVDPEIIREFEERRRWAIQHQLRGRHRYDPAAYELFLSQEALQAARAHYRELTHILEEQAREDRARTGRRVVGRRNLLQNADPFFTPRHDIVRGKACYKPRFIGSEKAVEAANKAYGEFYKNHKTNRRLLVGGRNYNIVFPDGTVFLRRVMNVRCRGKPLPAENPML